LGETDEEKAQQIFRSVSIKQSSFQGPFPPSEYIKGYNQAVSNGGERVIALLEKQVDHRQKVEWEVLRQGRIGQVLGFIIGVVAIGATVYMAIHGHDTVATIFGSTTIVGLVTAFVLRKKAPWSTYDQQKEDAQAEEPSNQ